MLLGVKTKKTLFYRHATLAIISAVLVGIVWLVNSTWSADMRLWKSAGGAGLALLWFTMLIGPLAKLWQQATKLLSWRRESGIWFALIALLHGYLILDGWARWNALIFLGYQYLPELEMYVRTESGFGLANVMGLMALIFALILAATSSDKAVNYLGVSAWKWLHMLGYVIFYITVLHVMYFAFIHYMPSLQRLMMGAASNYPVNPLRYYYVFAFASVFLVHILAFIKAVKKQKGKDWY